MVAVRYKLLLICVIFSYEATGQDGNAVATRNGSQDGFFPGPPPLGLFADESGARFFGLLRNSHALSEVPRSFEEIVAQSRAIARGYLVEILPGRSFTSKSRPAIPPLQTVFLKIQASRVIKGEAQQFYLVEYVAPWSMAWELSDELYSRELLFLLYPAVKYFVDAEITTSSEASKLLIDDPPTYNLTLRSSLFTISENESLTSAIDISREFNALYADIPSLDELESHILNLQAQSPR